jgi:hypothetical protein
MKRFFLILFLIVGAFLNATTIYLVNDSEYQLRAVIRGPEGAILGELVVASKQKTAWSNNYGREGQVWQPDYLHTPYSVTWYCMGGDEFSTCGAISQGSNTYVYAMRCQGKWSCKEVPAQPQGQEPSTEQQEGEIIKPKQKKLPPLY